MERKNNNPNSKIQEKRQVLISLSIEARALREEKKLKKYEFFPLCYLFSEKDVVFPNAKEKDVKEEHTIEKEKEIPAEIDNELINNL